MNKFILLFIFLFLSINQVCFANFITDDFAENFLSQAKKENENKVFVKPISDSLIDEKFQLKYSKDIYQIKNVITDDFSEKYLSEYKNVVYLPKKYDFLSLNKIIVKIKPKKYYSTRMKIDEGKRLEFVVIDDVYVNNKLLIPKNSIITGRIEMISLNKPKGVPSDLIIGNFLFKDISLDGNIQKTGAKRYYWVMPAAFALNSVFFVLGYPLWAVRGGHAKLTTHQKFEIYILDRI